jgi:hypothetical protein
MARFKMLAEQAPNGEEYGIEYVVNPAGAIWAVREDHPSPDWWPRNVAERENPQTLIDDAEQRRGGWRLATEAEIRAHAKANGEWLPPELEEKPAEKRGPGRPPNQPSA